MFMEKLIVLQLMRLLLLIYPHTMVFKVRLEDALCLYVGN
jgi:hypothetical protein